ncbi:hypothetical protein D9758_017405 [Tetrapyrgos nigripes]|uniref:Uncharacterized protein n=1 Tax=Tetrapyrgos nigripes TaxID=182062 RepID=A0A8H5C2C8_9AGAR|nr:hypothetical protein D9758_017405 [Tetrapyrgos nigripes]
MHVKENTIKITHKHFPSFFYWDTGEEASKGARENSAMQFDPTLEERFKVQCTGKAWHALSASNHWHLDDGAVHKHGAFDLVSGLFEDSQLVDEKFNEKLIKDWNRTVGWMCPKPEDNDDLADDDDEDSFLNQWQARIKMIMEEEAAAAKKAEEEKARKEEERKKKARKEKAGKKKAKAKAAQAAEVDDMEGVEFGADNNNNNNDFDINNDEDEDGDDNKDKDEDSDGDDTDNSNDNDKGNNNNNADNAAAATDADAQPPKHLCQSLEGTQSFAGLTKQTTVDQLWIALHSELFWSSIRHWAPIKAFICIWAFCDGRKQGGAFWSLQDSDAVDDCTLAFSPGGNLLAAGMKSGLLRIFALDNKYLPASFQLSSAITALIWGKDSNTEMLFIGEVNGHLHYVRRSLTWSAALSSQYDPLITMRDLQGLITALEISNHVRLLFVGDGGDIVVFPLDNISSTGKGRLGGSHQRTEGAVVVVGYLEHGIRASWDVHKRQQYWLMAVYNLYDGIELYWTDPINEPKTAQYRGQLVPTTGWGHRNMVLPVGILADSQWLIYGGSEGNTFIIDPNTGREIQRLNNHGDLGCSAIWADNDNGVERIALGTTGGLTGSITVYEYRDTTPRGTPLLTSPSPARSPKSVKIAPATSSSASKYPYPSSDIKLPHQNQSWKSASVPLSMIGCFVAVIMASIAIAVSYYGSPMTSRHEVVSQQVSKPTSSNTVTVVVFPQPTSSDTVTVIVPPHTTTHTMTITVSPVIVSPQPTSSDTVVVVSTHTMTDTTTVTVSPVIVSPQPTSSDTVVVVSTHTMTVTMTITVSRDIMTVTVFPKTSVLEDSWEDSWTCSANNRPTTETMTVMITESATMERQTETVSVMVTVSPTMDLHDFSVALGSSEWGQGISRAIQKVCDEIILLKERLDRAASRTGDWGTNLMIALLLVGAGAVATLLFLCNAGLL